jgi:AcrR family transcriptional regulator
MPRPFSSEERERIRRTLLERGREVFSTGGVRGTTILQLCRAAGISSGAFYSFFPSKEHLLLEILEDEERVLRREFATCLRTQEVTAATFASCLRQSLDAAVGNPLIRRLLDEEEYQILARRMPPGRLEAHIQGDIAFARPLITELQERGTMVSLSPEVITGMLRGLLMLSLHRREIGEEVYEEVMDLLLEFVARGLLGGDCSDDNS